MLFLKLSIYLVYVFLVVLVCLFIVLLGLDACVMLEAAQSKCFED
jgi:hypothetical protein